MVVDRFTDAIGSTETTHERESWSDVPVGWGSAHHLDRTTGKTTRVAHRGAADLEEQKVLAKIGRYTTLLDKAYYKHHPLWYQRSLMPPPAPRSRP